MAYRTMLRQLISKWGIMSIEMQNAYEGDMAYIKDDGTKEYVDNKEEEVYFEDTTVIETSDVEIKSLDDIEQEILWFI